jgi:predicted AAA+ superfamily ATPase
LAGVFVAATGSSAYDLKAGAERMAGRRGTHSNPDRALLPMGFAEFIKQWRRHEPARDGPSLLTEYFSVGGFPFRLDSRLNALLKNQPWDPTSGMAVFDDVLFYEINRRKLERTIALEVLGRLSSTGTSATSYEGFSKSLSVSRETSRRYLDAMGDAFLLATLSSYDTSRGRVAPKKDRKFIWSDPALAQLPAQLRQGDVPSDECLAEDCVGTELLRHYEARLFEGLSAPRNVFTWKSSGGNEIDFLVIDKARKLKIPVEVKYQKSISDWDFQILERSFGTGTLVTRDFSKTRTKAKAVGIADFLADTEK